MSTFPYTPLTEEECIKAKNNLLDPGIYDFEVFEAKFGLSQKKGVPQICLRLKVWDHDGKIHFVNDWLQSSENMAWKIKHFCDSVGLEKEYADGKFNELLCIFQVGRAKFGISKGKKIENSDDYYNDSNNVNDYLPRIANQSTVAKAMQSSSAVSGSDINNGKKILDDDVPF